MGVSRDTCGARLYKEVGTETQVDSQQTPVRKDSSLLTREPEVVTFAWCELPGGGQPHPEPDRASHLVFLLRELILGNHSLWVVGC